MRLLDIKELEVELIRFCKFTRRSAVATMSVVLLALMASRVQGAPGKSGYRLMRELPLSSVTGWDYLTIDPADRRLYVTDNSGAIVFDIDAGKVIGHVPNPPFTRGIGFVHGVAIARESNRGFLSHEVPPSVIVFDLKTLAPTGLAATSPGTDAVVYDPFSKRVFAFNGKKAGVQNATVIDAATGKSVKTVSLPGVPESAAVDNMGHLYVNIASKSEIAEIDTRTLGITAVWPLAPCQDPSGLAIDPANHRLFVGCDNRFMAMVNAVTGRVLDTVPIGDGVDANAFDPSTAYAFASCGDGTLTIAHEASPEKLELVEQVKTAPGARTMALDLKTHQVFLISARFEPHPPDKATPDNPHRYPMIIPGTARLLVLGR